MAVTGAKLASAESLARPYEPFLFAALRIGLRGDPAPENCSGPRSRRRWVCGRPPRRKRNCERLVAAAGAARRARLDAYPIVSKSPLYRFCSKSHTTCARRWSTSADCVLCKRTAGFCGAARFRPRRSVSTLGRRIGLAEDSALCSSRGARRVPAARGPGRRGLAARAGPRDRAFGRSENCLFRNRCKSHTTRGHR